MNNTHPVIHVADTDITVTHVPQANTRLIRKADVVVGQVRLIAHHTYQITILIPFCETTVWGWTNIESAVADMLAA